MKKCEWCGGCSCGYWTVKVFGKEHTICDCCRSNTKYTSWEEELMKE